MYYCVSPVAIDKPKARLVLATFRAETRVGVGVTLASNLHLVLVFVFVFVFLTNY